VTIADVAKFDFVPMACSQWQSFSRCNATTLSSGASASRTWLMS